MLTFEGIFNVSEPDRTKVKFNMNAGDPKYPAWDYLIKGETDPDWIGMNAYKTKQANNNLNQAKFLLSFAQYYPYGSNYYIFGGMYKITKQPSDTFSDRPP